MVEVDEHSIPAGIIRHFDLTSIPHESTGSRRNQYPGGLLFIDRLLALAGIDGPSLYPPNSPVGYRKLLGAIHTSPLDRLKKDCFYYYLLKDYSEDEDDGIKRSDSFAKMRCLSKNWRVFIDGYWNLDQGNWEAGITCLTNPGITEVNFPSEIIHTISTLAPAPTAMSLVHTFLLTRQPSPSTPQLDLEIYTVSLASASSVPEAFSFIRSLELERQGRLRECVWSWAFATPSTPCGLPPYTVSQKSIKEILHLPLLPHEDDHLLNFLLRPPRLTPEALSLLHDLVTLRLIHQGKYAESLNLDKALAGSGGNEDSRQRRREMVREFIAILPECQQRALQVDSGSWIGEKVNGGTEERNGYMSMEVEVIPRSTSTIKLTTPAFPLEISTNGPTPNTNNAAANAIATQPASPAPLPASPRISSPFSGPPRFAPLPNKPSTHAQSPISRVLSGSPFTLPMSRGANAVRSASSSNLRTPTQQGRELPIPRPKVRPVLEDQDENEEEKGGRRKRARISKGDIDMDVGDQEKEKEEDKENVQEPTQETTKDNGNDDIEHDHQEKQENQQPPEEETENQSAKPPSPAPTEPTPRTRRIKPPPPTSSTPKRQTRNSQPPPSPLARIPGSFDLSSSISIPQSVPEDQPLQPTRTRRSRTTRDLSAAVEEPPRSRMTRSVSRAISIDREDPPPPVPQKRVKGRRLSGASEISESATSTAATPKGRTRKNAGTGVSPTPSVTRSTRAGSQTPRKSTRVKK